MGLFLSIGITILLTTGGYLLNKRTFFAGLSYRKQQAIIGGNLNTVLAMGSHSEFAYLSDDINETVYNVKQYIQEASDHFDKELEFARTIQHSGLPSVSFAEVSLDDIPVITEFAEGEMERMGVPMRTMFQINVVIDEIYSNIVKFAYSKSPGPAKVSILEKQNPHRIYLYFEDEGMPYNPVVEEDPDISLSAEERQIGGLGIYMVKKTMDDMCYKYENGRNILTVVKSLED